MCCWLYIPVCCIGMGWWDGLGGWVGLGWWWIWCELVELFFSGYDIEFTNTPPWVVSGCPRLLSGAPDTLTQPIRRVHQGRGQWLLVRSCSCPQVKCKRSDVFFFCLVLVPQISTNFDSCSTSKSRGVGSVVDDDVLTIAQFPEILPVATKQERKRWRPICREPQPAVDETPSWCIHSLLRHS